MKKARFLWIDDEIELLTPYILFLEEKGYEVECVNSGRDGIEACRYEGFDMIFLDEHMPGLSGLETLNEIHAMQPSTKVVMVTKSEDESIMNKAIGRKIADYLIKPVNPNQILLTIKKNLDQQAILSHEATVGYQGEFARLAQQINNCRTADDWVSVYRKLVYWELEMERTNNVPMAELIAAQKTEANGEFAKFVRKHYTEWIGGTDERPVISPDLFRTAVFPLLDKGEKVFFILIDNFRLDQWQSVKTTVCEEFTCADDCYYSILPTTTQYARNSIFSGLMPREISRQHRDIWVQENDESNKNHSEDALLTAMMKREGRTSSLSYRKVNSNKDGEIMVNNFANLERYDLNVAVFNFIDMLSHARTESQMIRELASTEAAYRSLTASWFKHSPLMDLLRKIAEKGYKAILTTDHGTIRVKNPQKVVGDRSVNTNPRYKTARNISCEANKAFDVADPASVGLPSQHISTQYIFATGNDFFVYPNNYNQHVAHLSGTFQHGGVSMEEMIVPIAVLSPKTR